ncbi:cupin domain-containing protein [Propionibacteriaceae bacterium Y1923]|uniref:cupin domain-containing protein n=1 Tax=Aestuariimicrobium sp. Y1814 TaxID=3418742 RepID=UPI003C2995A7
MARVVISARDVEDAPGDELVVPEGAIVTALAGEVAQQRGIRLVTSDPSAPSSGSSAAGASVPGSSDDAAVPTTRAPDPAVRAAALALLAGGGVGAADPTTAGRHPVKHVRTGEERPTPLPRPGGSTDPDVRTADVVTAADGSPMTAGYMTLTCGTFPWHLDYDEIQVVLEGELHIGTLDGVRIGRPGDILFVPKGSNITFGTPSWTRFAYVTYPADWQG